MLSKKLLLNQLKNVPDPELGISIVDLGLVYGVKADKDGDVEVTMTLTTMGCPLFDLIEGPVRSELQKLKGVKDVSVELTFDPPWDPSKMSKEARVKLGFF
ncbi:metal-sulfur cluster assembly factor [Candidatus Gottesmanbacteria bacterium]|nr:metal-sulfur cluster assembly factor [Candidatus Gottesmanbacteria bacterium]